MVKHTQTIRQQFADESFECDHFVVLPLKELICLSNAFECINQELLIAKLHSYSFSLELQKNYSK